MMDGSTADKNAAISFNVASRDMVMVCDHGKSRARMVIKF